MIKRFLVVLLWCNMLLGLKAQNLRIVSLVSEPLDLSASTQARNDLEGNACGLVKVSIAKDHVSFEGNIVGQVDNHNGEYWVYLSPGTKYLKVKQPEFMPLMVTFADYNLSQIEGKTTYLLNIEFDRPLIYNREEFYKVALLAKEKEGTKNISQAEYQQMIEQYHIFVNVYNQWWDDIDEAKKYNDVKGLEIYRQVANTEKMELLWEGATGMAIVLDDAYHNQLLDENNVNRYNLMDVQRRKLHNRIVGNGEGLYPN